MIPLSHDNPNGASLVMDLPKQSRRPFDPFSNHPYRDRPQGM